MLMLVLTDQNFDEELKKAKLPVLVDFYADWCGPCKALAPLLEEIAGQQVSKLVIGKVDVDKNPHLARRFNIMSIPALLLFRPGETTPVKQLVGLQGREKIEKMVGEEVNYAGS
jgi:thioredoxin 1